MSAVWNRTRAGLALESIGPDPAASPQWKLAREPAAGARPGAIVELQAAIEPPDELHEACAALALALFDRDTTVWLSPTADARRPRTYLRLHTGCRQVAETTLADFALVARADELPSLASLCAGTQKSPQRSTTLILQLDALDEDGPWRLSGPGIRGERRLAAQGLGEPFLAEWTRNVRLFPRGVDAFLVSGRRMCGLPRTTRLRAG